MSPTSRLATCCLTLVMLYPWLVSYDDIDTNHVQITLSGGGGRYHQVQRDCGTNPVYSGDSVVGYKTDSVLLDRRAPYWDAAAEVKWNGALENGGVRVGVLALRDNGYVVDSESLLNAHTYLTPGQPFEQRLLWYANPFFEVHYQGELIGIHGSAGIWVGYVQGYRVQMLPTFDLGGNIDSSIFSELSYMASMPLISGGGLLSARAGTRLGEWSNHTLGWFGFLIGPPYSGIFPYARLDIPFSQHIKVNVVGMFVPDNFALSSGLAVAF